MSDPVEEKKPMRLSEKQYQPRRVNARFDSAQTPADMAKHWASADGMSADAAYSPSVRKTIRERARLEMENNPWARGIVATKTNDVVSNGPRLQMQTGDTGFDTRFENAWNEWCSEIGFSQKLRVAYSSDMVDGEGLGELITNGALTTAVKLDLQLFECERLTETKFDAGFANNLTDGIELDRWGNPAFYNVLETHPGDLLAWDLEGRKIPAQYVIHIFKPDRAEQHRGVSRFAPVLNALADIRRYTSAVIAAAETAADFALVIQSTGPNVDPASLDPMDNIDLKKRMATVLPEGWSAGGMKSDQPTTGYSEFVQAKVAEVARAFNMPHIVAAADSSNSNFSAAKMDAKVIYEREIRVEQRRLEKPLNKILKMFAMEISQYPGFRRAASLMGDHAWYWEGMLESDPREVQAEATRLENHATTYAEVYAKRGKDWERELRQADKENKLLMELGLDKKETTSPNESNEQNANQS